MVISWISMIYYTKSRVLGIFFPSSFFLTYGFLKLIALGNVPKIESYEKDRKRQRTRATVFWFIPQMPAVASVRTAKVRNQELSLGVPRGRQGPRHCCLSGSALAGGWDQVSNPGSLLGDWLLNCWAKHLRSSFQFFQIILLSLLLENLYQFTLPPIMYRRVLIFP